MTSPSSFKRDLMRETKEDKTVKAEKDVETASPREKQGLVPEKMPIAGELPHSSENKDKREVHTIRRVNTLKSHSTEKEDLGSSFREDSNEETEEQPMREQDINSTHLETSFREDPDCMLKFFKNTPDGRRHSRRFS